MDMPVINTLPPTILSTQLCSLLSPGKLLAMTAATPTSSVKVQTQIYSNTYTAIQLELNNKEDQISFKLFLNLEKSGQFPKKNTLVNVGFLTSKPSWTNKKMVKTCELQYFDKTGNILEKVATVLPDTLKQLDDVVEADQSFILSKEQLEYFNNLMARTSSKPFLSSTGTEVKSVKPAIQDLTSLQVNRVYFTNIEEMFVKVSLTTKVLGVVIRQEVSSSISGTDQPLTSALVTSEDYSMFSYSMLNPMSNIKYIISIPHKDTSMLPSSAVMWENVQIEQVPGSSLCRVAFNSCNESSFSASVPTNFSAVTLLVSTRKPFVISAEHLARIDQECLLQTSLPFILTNPLPPHLQLLSSKVPIVSTSQQTSPVQSQTPTPVHPPPTYLTPPIKMTPPVHPPPTYLTPPIIMTPPVPVKYNPTSKTMVFHTAKHVQSQSPKPSPSLISSTTTCPSCPVTFSLKKPSDVPVFAKHFYQHYPLDSLIIPEFLQRFRRILETESNTPTTPCPFTYCHEMALESGTASDTQNLEKHIRRKHQFEVLCFQLSTLCQDFEMTPVFFELMKNCKFENAKLFIHTNLKKYKAFPKTETFIIKSEDKLMIQSEERLMIQSAEKLAIQSEEKLAIKSEERVIAESEEKSVTLDEEADEIAGSSHKMSQCENLVAVAEVQTTSVITTANPIEKSISALVELVKTPNTNINESSIVAVTVIIPPASKADDKVNIIDKEAVINKNEATEIMKQFFRANVKNEDCRSFLKSRGEVMPIGMVDKLVFFLFDISSGYQESLQLIKFAVKNLKKIVRTDGSHLGSTFIYESESFIQMKTIQNYIVQYKDFCKLLHMNPRNCNSEILVCLIAKFIKQCNGDFDKISLFLQWLGKTHQKKGGKPVDQMKGIAQLTRRMLGSETNTVISWEVVTEKISSLAEVAFEKDVLKCGNCDQTFEDVINVLLHTGTHEETPVDVTCIKCNDKIETVILREKKDTLVFRAVLDLHLIGKAHIHNVLNEDKLPLNQAMCDPCNVVFSSPTDITQHTSTSVHLANTQAIKEYLEFCLARQLDPVNHQEFPLFIFFLRCIHSLSVNLQVPLPQTMDAVANIHSNFNNLLNVNESSDVRDEVIRKLSCGDPAMFFCFTCNQSFLTITDVEEHISSGEHEEDIESVEGPTVRCVVCKSFINTEDLQYHEHDIVESTDDSSDCQNVEVIDIDDKTPKENTIHDKDSNPEQGKESMVLPEQNLVSEVLSEGKETRIDTNEDESLIKVDDNKINLMEKSDDLVETEVSIKIMTTVESGPESNPDAMISQALDGTVVTNQDDFESTEDECRLPTVTINVDQDNRSVEVEPLIETEETLDTENCSKYANITHESEESVNEANGEKLNNINLAVEKEHLDKNLDQSFDLVEDEEKLKALEPAEEPAPNSSMELMGRCDETISWLLKEQDKTKLLKNSILNKEPVESMSKDLPEMETTEEAEAFGNPENYVTNPTEESTLEEEEISEEEIDLKIQELLKSSKVDICSLNDNVTHEKKRMNLHENVDLNNSNTPSWEFVPIKGNNIKFHVLPSVDSIPPDPVCDIKFDISIREILEMHKNKENFPSYRAKRTEMNLYDSKRKEEPAELSFIEYKKLKMDPKIFLSPCTIPSDDTDEKTDLDVFSKEEKSALEGDVIRVSTNNTDEGKGLKARDVDKKNTLENDGMKSLQVKKYATFVKNNITGLKKDDSVQQPMKRGRGRPRKNPIIQNEAMKNKAVETNLESEIARPVKNNDKNPSEDETKPIKLVEDLEKEVKLAIKPQALSKDNNRRKEDPNRCNEVENVEIIKKITMSSDPSNESNAHSSNLDEFEFGKQVADTSEEMEEDSSSEYEDSDDELEIIEEIVVDDGHDKSLNMSAVKLEPNQTVDKNVETASEIDQTIENDKENIEDKQETEPFKELSDSKLVKEISENPEFEIKSGENTKQCIESKKSNSLLSFPPNLSEEEKLVKTKELLGIEIIACNTVTANPKHIATKRKLEEIQTFPNFLPIKCDILVDDVAKSSEWRELVEPQVKYFRRRAAVINRWENDIQAYFKQRM